MAQNVRSTARGTDPWWMATHAERVHEENCGYAVPRLKDLPKLHKAVWKDDLQRVKTVLVGLKKTMYIDYFDKEHRTALHFACARGHDGMVKVICGKGANPNIADGQGKTPLHKAVESSNYMSVQHLLNSRADPDVTDDLGRTPLHLAAKMGDIPAVQLLLERGARTDIQEKDGLTAEHVATLNSNSEIVQLISRRAKAAESTDTDSDMVVVDEDDYEIVSPSACKVGGACSTPVSKERVVHSQSTESSDFELIFDTDDDDDCSIVNADTHYITSDCFTSSGLSSSDSSNDVVDQTSSDSESEYSWDSESYRSDSTCEFCVEIAHERGESPLALKQGPILLQRSCPDICGRVPTRRSPVVAEESTYNVPGTQKEAEETMSNIPTQKSSDVTEEDTSNVPTQISSDVIEEGAYNVPTAQKSTADTEESTSDESTHTVSATEWSSVQGDSDSVSMLSVPESVLSVSEDSGPDIIVMTDSEEEEEIKEEERVSRAEPTSDGSEPEQELKLSEEDELLRRQLALLDSFQMLVGEAKVVSKEHQLPSLKNRCPLYSFHEPIMFKFSDLALHFINDPSRVPVGENLIGLAGKMVALAWVSPEQMIEADPMDPCSLKVIISRQPFMQIMGLGVLQWIDFDDRQIFVVSPEVQTITSTRRVNTIVLGTPEYPQVHHCWPPAKEKGEVDDIPQKKTFQEGSSEQQATTGYENKQCPQSCTNQSGKPSPIVRQALLKKNSSSVSMVNVEHRTSVAYSQHNHTAQAPHMQTALSQTMQGTLPFATQPSLQQGKPKQEATPFCSQSQSTLPPLMTTLPLENTLPQSASNQVALPSCIQVTLAPQCTVLHSSQATLPPLMTAVSYRANQQSNNHSHKQSNHPHSSSQQSSVQHHSSHQSLQLAPPVQQLMNAYSNIPPHVPQHSQMNNFAVQPYQTRPPFPTGVPNQSPYGSKLNYLHMLQLSQSRQYVPSHPHVMNSTHMQQQNNNAAFNQLLHMLSQQQTPGPRFKPQEWFTSI